MHLAIIKHKLVHGSWHQVHISAGIKPGSQIKVSSMMGLQCVCQISYHVSWSWHILFFILLAFDLAFKQNESSLVLSSSEWSYEPLPFTQTAPACNWCALGLLGLKLACFFWKHLLVKCPNVWQALHW